MASLGELFIELGVLGDDEGAKKVAKSIDEAIDKVKEYTKAQKKQEQQEKNNAKTSSEFAKNLQNAAKGLGAIITAIGGSIVALNKLTDALVSQNQYWIDLTRNSDIALGTFQKWGMIGAAMNKSLGMQGAAGALADLNQRIFELKLTGEGARGFQLAGINPTNAEDVLEQLRSRIVGMNDTSATYLLKQLGIDPRMLSVLRMTRAEFSALNAEMAKYQLSPGQRQDIQDFHKQMSIINVQMQYFKDRIILKIMPHFLRFMRNIEFITEGFAKLAQAINKVTGKWKPLIAIALIFIAKIKPIAKFLTVINTAFGGLIAKIPIFGKYLVGLGGILGRVFLPLTALYLLIDDIRAFVQGGKSMIGVFLYGLEQIAEYINFETPEWIKNLIYLVSNIDNLAGAIQNIRNGEANINELDLGKSMNYLFNPLALGIGATRSIVNNTSNQVNQSIVIETNQPAQATKNQYVYALNNMN